MSLQVIPSMKLSPLSTGCYNEPQKPPFSLLCFYIMRDYVTLFPERCEQVSQARNWWQTKESTAKSIPINQRVLFCLLPGDGWRVPHRSNDNFNCSQVIKSLHWHGDSSRELASRSILYDCKQISRIGIHYTQCVFFIPLPGTLPGFHSSAISTAYTQPWEWRHLMHLVSFRDFLGPLNQFFHVS